MSAEDTGRKRRLLIIAGLASGFLVAGLILKVLHTSQVDAARDAAVRSGQAAYASYDVAAARLTYGQLAMNGNADFQALNLPPLARASLQTFEFGPDGMSVTYKLSTSVSPPACLVVHVVPRTGAQNDVGTRTMDC